MRTIIAGSRTATAKQVRKAIAQCPWKITMVISGGAKGADRVGEHWAEDNKVPLEIYPVSKAEWDQHGKKAGPMRNERMVAKAEALLAIWDGKSPGTCNMIAIADAYELRVKVYRIGE